MRSCRPSEIAPQIAETDDFYGSRRVVVSRDDVVDIRGIAIGVHNSEDGDTEALSFSYCDVLLHYVYDEESVRQLVHISDRAERKLELSTLTRDLELLALGEVIKRTIAVILSISVIFLTALRIVAKLVSIPPGQRSVT